MVRSYEMLGGGGGLHKTIKTAFFTVLLGKGNSSLPQKCFGVVGIQSNWDTCLYG